MSGSIPATLGNLTNLGGINLSKNQLSGPIPDLSRLTDLTQLDISQNLLTGTIPATLGSLSLTGMSLWGNQLTGTIPDALGNLSLLEQLILHENHLSGNFPAALGTLKNLKLARFASNTDADDNPSLTGCVPHGLRYLVNADNFLPNYPAHDFIPVDANRDGDFDDLDDTPGLNLPFCMLSALTFSSDVILDPVFASATAAYTASVASTVEATTVTATLDADASSSDRLSIRKGTTSYTSGAAVPSPWDRTRSPSRSLLPTAPPR